MAAQSPTDIWGLPGIQLDELTSNAMVTGNIVISSFTGPRRPATPTASTAGQDPMGFNCPIQGDLYWLCASGDLVFSNATISGYRNPVNEDPQLSGPGYAITTGSQAYQLPLAFPPIVAGESPGGVVPNSRSAPSSQRPLRTLKAVAVRSFRL
jgi:hypothetical protein